MTVLVEASALVIHEERLAVRGDQDHVRKQESML